MPLSRNMLIFLQISFRILVLSLQQNVGFTGGTISLQSDLTLENNLETDKRNYITAPISIRFVQPLFRYNSLKWEKRISPLEYERAKRLMYRVLRLFISRLFNHFCSGPCPD